MVRLAADHKQRCVGPWAARGRSRLAHVVQHLACLAESPPLPSSDAEALANAYASTGWTAHDAAIRVLEAVAPQVGASIEYLAGDRAVVVAALRAIYAPWPASSDRSIMSLRHDKDRGGPFRQRVLDDIDVVVKLLDGATQVDATENGHTTFQGLPQQR